MTQHSGEALSPTTTTHGFFVDGLSAAVQITTDALIAVREGIKFAPRTTKALNAFRDTKYRKMTPIQTLYLIVLSAIDDGKTPEQVLAWMGQFGAFVHAYYARKQARDARAFVSLLPFRDRWERATTKETEAQSAADIAAMCVRDGDLASMSRAKARLLEHRALIDAKVALLDEETARLSLG